MKKVLTLGLALILAFALCACGNSGNGGAATTQAPADTQAPAETQAPADTQAPAADIKPVELSVASYMAEGTPMNMVFGKIQDRANEILGGDYVTLTLYPSGTLAQANEALDALDSGLCDIACLNVSLFTNRLPIIELTEQPGTIFEAGQQVSAAVYDFIKNYEPAAKELEGYKFLGVLGAGGGAIYSKTPVHTMADMNNIQIRCTNATKEAVEKMGGIPVTLEWSECYEGLRNNLVDALYADCLAGKFINVQEVAEYYTYMPTLNTNTLYLMGDVCYNKLQPEVAEAILQAAEDVQNDFIVPVLSDATLNMTGDFLNGFKEVTIMPDEELTKIADAQAPILEAYIETLNGQGADGQAAYDAFKASLDKFGAEYSSQLMIDYLNNTCNNLYEGK